MSEITRIAVIGAGKMGSGIAQILAQKKFKIVLLDTKDEFIQRGMSILKKTLNEATQRKVLSVPQMDETLARISVTTELGDIADADLVIEAIFEDKTAKTELFRGLDSICGPDTIIATNTSNLCVNAFAKEISRPDRFIGMHYFYHPAKNKLVEVIPAEGTSRATIDKALHFALLHGKKPILVKDSSGFAVNRYFVPSLNESARMLEENLSDIATIEEAYRIAFGVGMGAFELMNATGVPLAAHGNATLAEAHGAFYTPCNLLKRQTEKNENWKVEGIVDASKVQDIIDRLYGLCLGIAATMIDEGIASMEDIDTGATVGLRWKKGPFDLMTSIGIDRTYSLVEETVKRHPDFTMPRMLSVLKESGCRIDYIDSDIAKAVSGQN